MIKLLVALVKFIPLLMRVVDGISWLGKKGYEWYKSKRKADIHEIDNSADVTKHL